MSDVYEKGEVVYVRMFDQFVGMLNVPNENDTYYYRYSYISDYIVSEWGFFDTNEYLSLYPGNCEPKSLSFKLLHGTNSFRMKNTRPDIDTFLEFSNLDLRLSYVSCYNDLLHAYDTKNVKNVWVFPALSEIKKLKGFENVPDDDLFFCR